jgi:hypothetical protein
LKWVKADLLDAPAGQLVGGEEAAVEEGDVDLGQDLLAGRVPGSPRVRVGNVEECLPGTRDQVADRVGVFVAMGHGDGAHLDAIPQLDGGLGANLAQLDVLALHQQAPRAVLAQEREHARRAPDRHA